MLYYLRIYRLLFVQFLKTRMEYRLDFVISFIGMGLRQVVGLFALWVLFQSVTEIAGWSVYELIFVYGYVQLVIVPQQTFLENLWNFTDHLREGTFIKYYMRPLNPMFYFLSDAFDLKSAPQLVIGIIAVVTASVNLQITWDFASLLFLLVAYICSVVILSTLMMIAAATGFWTLSSTSVMLFAERLKSYAHFPLAIYNKSLRLMLSYVLPLGFVAYYPCLALLKTQNYFSTLLPLLFTSSVFCLFAWKLWNIGIRRYEGTGS